MSDKREMDEFAIYNNVSPLISNFYPLTSNLHLHIFTGKSIRSPPFSNIHVGNLKSPRGYFLFSTWASFISSEVSFHSSEVSFDSSEEFFIHHVEILKYPRGNPNYPTSGRFDLSLGLNYCNDPALNFPSQTS